MAQHAKVELDAGLYGLNFEHSTGIGGTVLVRSHARQGLALRDLNRPRQHRLEARDLDLLVQAFSPEAEQAVDKGQVVFLNAALAVGCVLHQKLHELHRDIHLQPVLGARYRVGPRRRQELACVANEVMEGCAFVRGGREQRRQQGGQQILVVRGERFGSVQNQTKNKEANVDRIGAI